jgi:hypothetical protein
MKMKQIKQLISNNRQVSGDAGKGVPSSGENIILQRLLGHSEIGNSGKWNV